MNLDRFALAAFLAVLALGGCDTGARQVDYSQQRAISSDISNSLDRGPTAGKPGMMGIQEPLGAMPWEINQSRQ